jgi:2-polyprenyl-3-methyl-5-hydroxy-6-metoxy-1,4-benzoquinol methylase
MNKWLPSKAYANVAEANRCFYSQRAALYDATETPTGAIQAMLEADIDRVLKVLGKRQQEIRALDACGGTGNISLKLLRRGIQPTLADISPELLEIFREKCESNVFKCKIVCKEIGVFLAEESGPFDLIIFSSALHHLENFKQVLTLAFDRLAPRGVLFTVFDPTSRSQLRRLTRFLQRMEYYIFKVFYQSSDLPEAIGRRLRRILTRASASNKGNVAFNLSTVGMVAEYHVEQGIDDLDLLAYLEKVGFEVVRHDRYVGTRFAWIDRLIRWLGDATHFKLILRKPASPTR